MDPKERVELLDHEKDRQGAELGHYIECITFTDEGREWIKEIPRN